MSSESVVEDDTLSLLNLAWSKGLGFAAFGFTELMAIATRR
jgi:hypothetical protein